MILKRRLNGDPITSVRPVGKNAVQLLRAVAEKVTVSDEIERYIVSLVSATRMRSEFSLGASPRASVALMRLSRAWRCFITGIRRPGRYSRPVQRGGRAQGHNVKRGAAAGIDAVTVLDAVLKSTAVPYAQTRRGFGI